PDRYSLPTRRSSDLGLAKIADGPGGAGADAFISYLMSTEVQTAMAEEYYQIPAIELDEEPAWLAELGLEEMELDILLGHRCLHLDRKSTRLNSSHVS